MQPPDRKRFEREVGVITHEIKEKEAKLKPVSWSPSQDINSQLTQITGELAGIEEKKGSNTAEVRRIEDQLKKLGTEIIRMRDDASKLSAGLRHKSEARIDDMVGKLEQQLQTKQFPATEERTLQLEIDALKKSKERLKEYQETKEKVETMRNEQDQLRKRRDSFYRSTRDLRDHESELKDRQVELKKGLEEKREKHREFKAQKELLSKEIDELYKQRTQLRENFRQQQTAYLEATKEERKAERAIREEEARKREDERRLVREARRRKQAIEMEMQREFQYDEEKTVCRTLIAHLQSLSLAQGPSSTSFDQLEAESPPSPTTRSSAHSTVPDLPGEFLPRKTGEQEGMLFPPSGRRRSRRERKRNAPATKAPKRLNYNATIFKQFSFLGINPPTTQPEIESAVMQLQDTLAFYESKSVSKPPPSEAGDSGVCVDVSEHELTSQEDVILDTIGLSRRPSIDPIQSSPSPLNLSANLDDISGLNHQSSSTSSSSVTVGSSNGFE